MMTENQGVDSSNLSLGTWNTRGGDSVALGVASPPSVAFFGGAPVLPQARVATMVDWAFAPVWLSVPEACFLSRYGPATLYGIIDEGGVDVDNGGRIDKESLWQFLEADALVLHWDD